MAFVLFAALVATYQAGVSFMLGAPTSLTLHKCFASTKSPICLFVTVAVTIRERSSCRVVL